MLAINFVDNSFGDLFSPLEYGQIGPLGWLWLEKLMFDLGDGEVMWMRLPALLAGFSSVFVFWGIANKILDSTSALLALAVFCASYYLVRYSVEIKPYSFDLLVALLLIRSGLDRAVARFFWIATIGVFFSLPSMFVAAGVGLFLFHRLKSKRP
ncbi:MAG: glycosyltransferase family 39 protein, partial [Planctomycetota bacterium]|nr:glycosyltransferase family 39 protein [Planctomycetota bacterium]